MRWTPRLALLLTAPVLLWGCPAGDDDTGDDDAGDDDVGDDDVGDDDSGDDDTGDDDSGDDDTLGPGPCGADGWGMIADPAHSIHVHDGGDDAGTGTVGDPLETLSAALALSRQEGQPDRIALWPGDFREHGVSLTGEDDGLAIEGCSSSSPEILLDSGTTFSIAEATGVRLAGVAIWGGEPGLTIHGGAEVEVESVGSYYPKCSGMWVLGAETTVHAEDVGVITGFACMGNYGAGYFVDGATATFVDASVWDTCGAGFVGVSADLTIRDSSSSCVCPVGSPWSRGVHLEGMSTAVIEDSSFYYSWDAGIFSMDSLSLTITGCTIGDTNAEDTAIGSTGDGIVVTQSAGNADPAQFLTVLEGNIVADSPRAGVVVSGVTAELSGTTTKDGIYAQNGAITSGTDTVTAPQTPCEFDETTAPF